MANEVTATFGLSVSGGPILAAGNIQSLSDWSASQGSIDFVKSVGTTESAIESTGITTNGTIHLWNLDSTNFVEWGLTGGSFPGRIKPGRHAQFDVKPGVTLYIKADTAACRVRVVHVGGA